MQLLMKLCQVFQANPDVQTNYRPLEDAVCGLYRSADRPVWYQPDGKL
jgi:hypothetical protein